jgi:hypothetical protein
MTDDITREEIESVADKLNRFAAGLSESEQRVLAWIVVRAEAADDEVRGYLGAPQPTGLVPRVRPAGPRGIIAILIG